MPAGPNRPVCLPADHLLAVGFKTVRPHPRFPRLRLELRTTLSWKEDVELALDRLVGGGPEGAGPAPPVDRLAIRLSRQQKRARPSMGRARFT